MVNRAEIPGTEKVASTKVTLSQVVLLFCSIPVLVRSGMIVPLVQGPLGAWIWLCFPLWSPENTSSKQSTWILNWQNIKALTPWVLPVVGSGAIGSKEDKWQTGLTFNWKRLFLNSRNITFKPFWVSLSCYSPTDHSSCYSNSTFFHIRWR